jgi:hypothetical protein
MTEEKVFAFEQKHWSAWFLYRTAINKLCDRNNKAFVKYILAAATRGHKDAIDYVSQFEDGKPDPNFALMLTPIMEFDKCRSTRPVGHPRYDRFMAVYNNKTFGGDPELVRQACRRVLAEYPDDAYACSTMSEYEPERKEYWRDRARRCGSIESVSILVKPRPLDPLAALYRGVFEQSEYLRVLEWDEQRKYFPPLIPYLGKDNKLFGRSWSRKSEFYWYRGKMIPTRQDLGANVFKVAQHRRRAVRDAIVTFILCCKEQRILHRDIVLLIGKHYILQTLHEYDCVW